MPNERIELVDITPDRSILHKIGETNYSISDAIAELVDNSIDATNDNGVEVIVVFDKTNKKIIIKDNGIGMDKVTAAKSLVLAHSEKTESLGEYGLGLKSACTSLGDSFTISTTPKGAKERYSLKYEKNPFLKEGDWRAFPVVVSDAKKEEHGTNIEIGHLRVKLYDALVTRVKKDLSQRYSPFIKHNNVIIRVGLTEATAKPCTPEEVVLDDNGKRQFEYILNNGKIINGWWSLLKVASGTRSGFDMFRRGRLIRSAEKLGYPQHPMTNQIIGEIHLDPVPVTHNKREFITESVEFKEFIEKFWGDKTNKYTEYRVKGLIDEIVKEATARWNQTKAEKQLPEPQKEKLKSDVLRALNRVEDFKELAFPDLAQVKKRSDDGVETQMEQREASDRKIATEEIDEDRHGVNEKRTPHKTQNKKAKFIMINGKKFNFEIILQNLQDDTLDKQFVITEKGLEIFINTGFKGYDLSADTNFYCIFHAAEALAQVYLKETAQGMGRVFELRNKLLYEVSSVVKEEEEYKKIAEQEVELSKIVATKKQLEEKRQKSML